MLFRRIVKKYIADLILLTKFKKIIGMKEIFVQNIEVPVGYGVFTINPRDLWLYIVFLFLVNFKFCDGF